LFENIFQKNIKVRFLKIDPTSVKQHQKLFFKCSKRRVSE